MPTADCLRLGAELAALAPRVALLAMGDASARKVAGVHGAADPAAERYDAEVRAAFAAADPGRLARLDAALDGELMVAGRAAWQVLAGAAGAAAGDGAAGAPAGAPGAAAGAPGVAAGAPGVAAGYEAADGGGGRLRGQIRFAAAPLDVTYLVASWAS